MNIKELLNQGYDYLKEKNIEEYNLKAKMILSNILKCEKEYLIIHDEDLVDENCIKQFTIDLEKIAEGIPVQYITNHQEFMGLDFFVNENVLIPQPDTEVLVENVLSIIKDEDLILDLCTGSGAIGISIAKLSKKDVNVKLSDISEKAIEVAKINAEKNDAKVDIIQSDLFDNIFEKFDIIASNPPYIETETIKGLSIEVRNEPMLALDGGEDGLDFYRRISKEAKKHLRDNGLLFLEIGYNQKESVSNILKNDGYCDIKCIKDYSENDRVIICKRGE